MHELAGKINQDKALFVPCHHSWRQAFCWWKLIGITLSPWLHLCNAINWEIAWPGETEWLVMYGKADLQGWMYVLAVQWGSLCGDSGCLRFWVFKQIKLVCVAHEFMVSSWLVDWYCCIFFFWGGEEDLVFFNENKITQRHDEACFANGYAQL